MIKLLAGWIIMRTRSCAALRAADLDRIVGPGYNSGGYILEKNHEKPTWNHEKPWKSTWNPEKPWNLPPEVENLPPDIENLPPDIENLP